MSIFNQAKMENLLTYLLNTSLIVYCMYNCSFNRLETLQKDLKNVQFLI